MYKLGQGKNKDIFPSSLPSSYFYPAHLPFFLFFFFFDGNAVQCRPSPFLWTSPNQLCFFTSLSNF
jgi:hypothetical protein